MKIKTKRGPRRVRNQRVTTKRFVTTDYTGCSYITAGKLYSVVSRSGNYTEIFDDTGRIVGVNRNLLCAHLNRESNFKFATL